MKKKLLIIFFITIISFSACSNENDKNKLASPHQNKIDSLALVKEHKAIEANKLKHQLDSLKKHLDSLKAISSDLSQ